MTTPPDPFWDDLGVAWTAINPDISMILPRLESRLRRQSVVITASLIVGLPLSIAGFLLGVNTIWSGWTRGAWNFVTRGVAVVMIAAILSAAMSSLLRVRTGGDARSLSQMLDLAVARAKKAILIARLGLYACGVTALLGLVGAAIRTRRSGAPTLSPFFDVFVLTIFALGLFLCSRRAATDLAKYRYLKHVLVLGESK